MAPSRTLSFRTYARDYPRISFRARSGRRLSFPRSAFTLSRAGLTVEADGGGPPTKRGRFLLAARRSPAAQHVLGPEASGPMG